MKNVFLEMSQNSQENTCARVSFLLKNRLWHRSFPVNFAKFLRTPFFTDLRCLRLSFLYTTYKAPSPRGQFQRKIPHLKIISTYFRMLAIFQTKMNRSYFGYILALHYQISPHILCYKCKLLGNQVYMNHLDV